MHYKMMWEVVLFIVWNIFTIMMFLHLGDATNIDAESTPCCDVINTLSCARLCSEVMVRGSAGGVELSEDQQSDIGDICPQHLDKIIECYNDSLASLEPDVEAVWSGRECCQLAWSNRCKNACKRAHNRTDVKGVCRTNDELALLSCLDRQQVSTKCCDRSQSTQCRSVCRSLFIEDSTPTEAQRSALNRFCGHRVTQCVRNHTQDTPVHNPAESLPCCQQSSSPRCQQNCQRVLTTLTSEEEILNGLISTCGQPLLGDPLWQCFLKKSSGVSRPSSPRMDGRTVTHAVDITAIDATKLSCCNQARSSNCYQLCVRTYSRDWSITWDRFHAECLLSPREMKMTLCLEEVDHPCSLGCDGLSYCSNFNAQPTRLFRKCTPEADTAARKHVLNWLNGVIRLPLIDDIPVRDIRVCHPDLWQAVACTLEVKPCHANTHTSNICMSDCLHLLGDCVDYNRLSADVSVESLCAALSAPAEDKNCISLRTYLDKPRQLLARSEFVESPCKPNPCNSTDICVINHRKCRHPETCKTYICKPACSLGEVSRSRVAHGSHVMLPNTRQQYCYRACTCSHNSVLSHCEDVGCIRRDSCLINADTIQAHGTTFQLGCSFCTCYSGEVICQRRECIGIHAPLQQRQQFTGLPCGCEAYYSPVCGNNGQTYPNDCVAICNGLTNSEIQRGSCRSLNPCLPNRCQYGQICVPHHRVCITAGECNQYECISLHHSCNTHLHQPVCSTRGVEYSNPCVLTHRLKYIGYHGHCMTNCDVSYPVCGVNGETYSHECAALADEVLVDYVGPCRSISQLRVGSTDPSCVDIICPRRFGPACHLITPPGACCPVCVGEIRVLLTHNWWPEISSALSLAPLTLRNFTAVLAQHVSILDCGVYAYMSLEHDLVVLIAPNQKQPTYIQVSACMTEAHRLGFLLREKGALLTAHITMATVATANVRTALPYASIATHSVNINILFLLFLVIVSIFVNCAIYTFDFDR